MTVIALPSIPGFASVEWALERNVATFESPLTRVAQRLSRTGHRWRVKLQCPQFQNNDAGIMAAWLDQISRGDRWFYLSPPQNGVRGAWSPANLLSNGDFAADATTGWTAVASTLSINARRLRVKNSGASIGVARQDFTGEANKPYVVLADAFFGNVSSAKLSFRNSATDAEIAGLAIVAPARGVLLVTPTVTTQRLQLRTETAVSGDSVLYGGVSATRCLQVNGASQTGNRLNVDGGPLSTNAALRAGEFICVKVGTLYQLVRLVEDFDTDSTGAGVLVFEPLLRGSPADNDPVIVRYPFARFRLAESMSVESVRAPNFRGFTLEGVEDVTP